MDWDLWGPIYNQVSVDHSYGTQAGSQFGYYFGFEPDVLEETALNEKYCVQVLRIKNTKADAEIDQLEEDLVVLQSRLLWTEDEECSEKCFAALREKIDCLNSSILSLKNEEEHNVAHLTMHREPAEKIHEIMKVLLQNYLEKDEQPLDVIVRESSSDTLGHATDLLVEGKQFSKFDSNIAVKQEIQEPTFAPSEKCTAPNLLLKPEGRKTDFPKEGLATDLLDERKKFSNFDSNRAVKEDIREPTMASLEKCTAPNSSSKLEGKKTIFSKQVKTLDIIDRSSSGDTSKNVTGHSNGKKSNHSDLKFTMEEVNKHQSIPLAKDMILDLPLEPGEKKTDVTGKVKSADISIKASSLDTSKSAAVCSDGSPSLCDPVSKVHGLEEVTELKFTTTDTSISLNSFPKCAEKGTNIPKTNKPVDATVRNFSSDSLRHATCLHSNNGENINSGSSLNAVVQAKSGDTSVKPIKSNFTSENTRNECIKESKGALTGKNDSSNSLLKMDEKMSPLLRKIQDAVIIDTENIAVVSNLGLQVQHEKDTTQQKLEEERKTRACEGQRVEIVANDKSNLNCPRKSQKLKELQRKFLPKSLIFQAGSVPMKVIPGISSISKAKKRRKSRFNDDATLVEIMNESKCKKLVDPNRCGAQVCGVTPDVSKKSVPPSQKKRKMCPDYPIILEMKDLTFQKELLKLHRDTTDAASEEDNRISNSCAPGISDDEVVPSLPTSRIEHLNVMSMVDLKAIAKKHKVTGYSRLRKSDLIQLIATQMQ